jgi:hypothetical protein
MAKEKILIEKSMTSDVANVKGKDCVFGRFITEEEGWKIVEAARAWEGTPYRLVGENSIRQVGGDCSGTTNKSYATAGFPYPYQSTANFAAYVRKSLRFRKIIPANQELQAGDIILWPGHMAIYAPFPENDFRRDTGVVLGGRRMENNIYTAFNSHSNKGYGPYNIQTFRGDAYTVYRYLVAPSAKGCPK